MENFPTQIPKDRDSFKLFLYSVQKAFSLGIINEAKTHQAWANLIFSEERNATVRSELMSIVKREYTAYFDQEQQYKFLGDKIREHFAEWLDSGNEKSLFERILQALENEYSEQKDYRNQKKYKVSSCHAISKQVEPYVYKASLKVEEGDDPHFPEGMPFDYRTEEYSYACEVIEYDYINATLFFSSQRVLHTTYKDRVVCDASMNTKALMDLLSESSSQSIKENLPLYKFLHHTTHKLNHLSTKSYPDDLNDLLKTDESQYAAFKASLAHDITFIWGPPGTGKSYTLAIIIMALYSMKGERTAVCCLSNVAVDQLIHKVIKLPGSESMPPGEFYRAGRTQDVDLLKNASLYPNDLKSKILKLQIEKYLGELDEFKLQNKSFSDEAILLKAKIKEAKEKLKDHTNHLINQVSVVFSTISNFIINPMLKDGKFDNLIVDEASMLAEPQLIALARNVSKRIILVGDFQQLAPISISGHPILRNNVFKLCGIDIDHTSHPALHPLLNQRRSNPQLVDIINRPFYNNQLKAINRLYNYVIEREPYSGSVLGMRCITDGEVRFTKGGTRQNKANALAVMELLDIIAKDEKATYTIGVITPYKGQVSLLKALFMERDYNTEFQTRVKIGTVHTFQGSESDIILFDMVDCSKFAEGKQAYFGKIYAGKQGEQLLNVAISRAKNKLIVICDPPFISRCPGGVISDRSYSIFRKLLTARGTQMQ